MNISFLRQDQAENSIMQTITIAVSAILIAAGLVTAPGLINNARDNNARTDLDNIAFSQEFALGSSGEYFTLDAEGQPDVTPPLENIRYSLSGSTSNHLALVCDTPSPAYLLRATSASERTFYRASGAALTSDDLADLTYPQCIQDQIDAYDIANPGDPFVVAGPGGGGGTPSAPLPVNIAQMMGGGSGMNFNYPSSLGADINGGGPIMDPTAFAYLSDPSFVPGTYPITGATAWIGSTQVPVTVGSSQIDISPGGFSLYLGGFNGDFYVGDGSWQVMNDFIDNGTISFSIDGVPGNAISMGPGVGNISTSQMADSDFDWAPVVEFHNVTATDFNCRVRIQTIDPPGGDGSTYSGVRPQYLTSLPFLANYPAPLAYNDHINGTDMLYTITLNNGQVISGGGSEFDGDIWFQKGLDERTQQLEIDMYFDAGECAGLSDDISNLIDGASGEIVIGGTTNTFDIVLTGGINNY